MGSKLTVSLQALQLEVGTNVCPLLTPFQPLGPLRTPCCMRSFWQCLDHYRFELEINYPTLQQPQENDVLLSSAFVTCTSDEVTLRSLQRFCITWGILFLLDMDSEYGKLLDAMYIKQPFPGKSPRSRFLLGKERPTRKIGYVVIDYDGDSER